MGVDRQVAGLLAAGFLAASFDAVAGRFIPPPYDRITLLLFLASASAAVVLLSVGADAKQNLLDNGLSLGPLRYLGRISYGIYLYHGIPLYLLWEHAEGGWWWRLGWAAAVLSISVAAAALSDSTTSSVRSCGGATASASASVAPAPTAGAPDGAGHLEAAR